MLATVADWRILLIGAIGWINELQCRRAAARQKSNSPSEEL